MAKKKNNKKEEKKPKELGYKEGAIAGGVVGLIVALYFKKSIVWGTVGGLMIGGYLGHLFFTKTKKEVIENKTKFKPVY